MNDVFHYEKRVFIKRESFFKDENLVRNWKRKVILRDKEKWKQDRHKSRKRLGRVIIKSNNKFVCEY